jgi:pyruvate dehydrogenase E2 component (dihydrolipoamide acetyltransferase)
MNVLMPQLGETVTEGTVAKWHKNAGDHVQADEILLDIETDKVSMEVPAPTTGVLTKILVETGKTVEVGTVLAVIESADAAAEAAPPGSASQSAIADADSAASSTAPAAEDPSTVQAAARGAQDLEADSSSAASQAPAQATALNRDAQRRLSPAVRRLAAEYRLDLAAIPGTGRNGRITRRNVVDFIAVRQAQGESLAARETSAAAVSGAAAAAPRPAGAPPGSVVPFNRIRRLTAEHMVRSKATSPHVLQAVEVDFHRVEQIRKSVRDAWKAKHGYSLTYLPFIARAVCEALAEFPNVNASVEGDALVLHEHVHLGIAIDLGAEGLIAPIIKTADRLSIAELSTAINDLAQRARSNKLKPDELKGGTYTISNNGTFGTLITAPIINQPQVAILSTDGVRKKPVVIEGSDGDSIAIRPVGILAQSFDHRAIDGAYSGAFLNRLRTLLEAANWTVDV